jgi:DNA-binding NarL/FixJ family response regulator
MTRVFIAETLTETRSALRLLLMDLNMTVVGEANNWPTALARVMTINPDMLVVEWELQARSNAGAALVELRAACPNLCVVVLSSQLDARHAALRAGADGFISKGDAADRVMEHLRAAADGVHS